MMQITDAGKIAIGILFGIPLAVTAGSLDPFSTGRAVSASPAISTLSQSNSAPCRTGPPDAVLDLLEIVERSLCSNPQTRQAWANARAQAEQLGIATSAYLPSVNVSYALSRGDSRTSVSGLPPLSHREHTTVRDGSLALTWILFDFGLRKANLESAEHLLAAADASHESTLQKVLLAAAQSYFDLLTAQGGLDASMEGESLARESFAAADAKYRAGVGALADKLQAQTNYAQAVLARVKAEGEVKIAHGTLAVTMGLDANTPVRIATNRSPSPEDGFLQSVDSLIEEAKQRHPSLLSAQAQLRSAQASISAVKAEGLPSLSLTGNVHHSDQYGQFPSDTFAGSSSVGVQLKIPLLEGFGRTYRIRAAEAQAEAKAAELANTEQQISLEVWKSYQALRTEVENLRATEDLLRSAEQSFKVGQGRYKAGVGSILELLSAQSALANAMQQRVQAQSAWRTARLRLVASLGRLGVESIR